MLSNLKQSKTALDKLPQFSSSRLKVELEQISENSINMTIVDQLSQGSINLSSTESMKLKRKES
jgi:hypothetical protein